MTGTEWEEMDSPRQGQDCQGAEGFTYLQCELAKETWK